MKRNPFIRIFPRTKKGAWNRRIYDVAGAMGWTLEEMGQHMGYRSRPPLIRVLNGGRPSVDFLLRLQALESVYEREIRQFIKSRRPYMAYRIAKLDGLLHQVIRKQDDLTSVGVVAAVAPYVRRNTRWNAKRTVRTLVRQPARRKNRVEDNPPPQPR